ncbi:PhoU family transcriptional regulator [Haloterrigena sp. H1]|uniref:PhoU family transcriptional regulator n=1 Tax=Haloterrigena sp. H1 TaxID=2552943 RepID=UPI00110E8B18|nr:PhoU family transcriptional regulator [Haloterrigena sp. H1]TMT81543.1 PhoU family transcriptional regulator [Haloterrigena sp. H1]
MFREMWHRPQDATRQGRDATIAQVIESIDRTAPETKARLAADVGISEQYLSELLQELKADDIVRKAYVVDNTSLYANADALSPLDADSVTNETADTDHERDVAEAETTAPGERGETVLDLLARLEDVTTTQYAAARQSFVGAEPERPADTLESLANERHSAVLSELKSYTLTTDWPGNRVAADLATIATNLEIVGDRACFITDVIDNQEVATTGVVEERVCDIFDAGKQINDYLTAILFECDLAAHDDLIAQEETVHRDLDELFELVTAYDPEMYGYLVTVTRALERAIYYWVHAAEIAVRLHSGVQPDHVMI